MQGPIGDRSRPVCVPGASGRGMRDSLLVLLRAYTSFPITLITFRNNIRLSANTSVIGVSSTAFCEEGHTSDP